MPASIPDCKFMAYTPSMIAAGCIGAAMQGLSTPRMVDSELLQRLYEITSIEIVSIFFYFDFMVPHW